jgi:beta-glucosidase
VDRWIVEPGAYRLEVAASSRDIRSSVIVEVEGDAVVLPLTMASSIGDVVAHPVAGPIVMEALGGLMGGLSGADSSAASMMPNDEAMEKMMASFPIGRLIGFPGVDVTYEQIEQLLDGANAQLASQT